MMMWQYFWWIFDVRFYTRDIFEVHFAIYLEFFPPYCLKISLSGRVFRKAAWGAHKVDVANILNELFAHDVELPVNWKGLSRHAFHQMRMLKASWGQ